MALQGTEVELCAFDEVQSLLEFSLGDGVGDNFNAGHKCILRDEFTISWAGNGHLPSELIQLVNQCLRDMNKPCDLSPELAFSLRLRCARRVF